MTSGSTSFSGLDGIGSNIQVVGFDDGCIVRIISLLVLILVLINIIGSKECLSHCCCAVGECLCLLILYYYLFIFLNLATVVTDSIRKDSNVE